MDGDNYEGNDGYLHRQGGELARMWGLAINHLKPNCHPRPLLPEINGSYQRCPPNSSQRMGPSLFSNCVKILWNLKEIVRSNDDGSSGVNLEYHVTSSTVVKLFYLKNKKEEIWKICVFSILSFPGRESGPGRRSHAGSGMVTTPKRRKYNSRHWETSENGS